jgi:basic amino acid/polyamine antiporter, APA family
MKAAEMFLPYGTLIALGGGMVSTLAVLNATTFSSARVAFADTAKRSFEPLKKILDRENIPSHYLVRVSHDSTEAILATHRRAKDRHPCH